MADLSIYIHIPFCAQKCFYCAFFSQTGQEQYISGYCEALQSEISFYANDFADRQIKTIYFGGGTPSLLPAEKITEIITTVRKKFSIHTDAEITVEANPESITAEKLAEYATAGVNRMSIGVQAWQPHLLAQLNRPYQIADFERVMAIVQQSDIKNINLDLMFGLPNQTLEEWRESLAKTIACNPTHISCYSLEVDNHSKFGRLAATGNLHQASNTIDRKMYAMAVVGLKNAGYRQYEISNFSKQGCESQHNTRFWQNEFYLGFGAGAESFVDNKSWTNISHIANYISSVKQGKMPQTQLLSISKKDLLIQKIALGLRLSIGINVQQVNQQFSTDLTSKCKTSLTRLTKEKLIIVAQDHWKLTKLGRDVIDHVITLLAADLIEN